MIRSTSLAHCVPPDSLLCIAGIRDREIGDVFFSSLSG
jgi:hypothetical protein